MPGGLDGIIYELPNILWSVVVVNTETTELLFDLADPDGRIRMCYVLGIDGRCDFLNHLPPSFSAFPGHI